MSKPDESTWRNELEKLERFKETVNMARKKPAAVANAVLDVPVKFGSVSIRKTVTHIGCTAQRKALSIKAAEKNLDGRRLIGAIEMRPDEEDSEQGRLPGLSADRLAGAFDVKSFNVNGDEISFGLTFPKRGVDFGVLSLFASQTGRLVIDSIEKIVVEDKKAARAAQANGSGNAPEGDDEDGDDQGDDGDEEYPVGRYASETTVPVEKSRAEIEETLRRYKASAFTSGWTENAAMVAFKLNDLFIRFVLPILPVTDKKFAVRIVRGHRVGATEPQRQRAHEQEMRQRWRALLLVVKAKLEAVECGISTLEKEFLAFIVMPNDQTLGVWIAENTLQAIRDGRMPRLLTGPKPEDVTDAEFETR